MKNYFLFNLDFFELFMFLIAPSWQTGLTARNFNISSKKNFGFLFCFSLKPVATSTSKNTL